MSVFFELLVVTVLRVSHLVAFIRVIVLICNNRPLCSLLRRPSYIYMAMTGGGINSFLAVFRYCILLFFHASALKVLAMFFLILVFYFYERSKKKKYMIASNLR